MRLSVTDIDQYRYWRESDYMTLDELLSRLRRESPPTEQMALGTAFHKALELASEGEASTLESDGFTFKIASSLEIALTAIREIKAAVPFVVDGTEITLVGKVDAWEGLRIEDHKTTFDSFDPEKYINTYQWRFYLRMFDCSEFRWNVWRLKEARSGAIEVVNLDRFSVFRYPELEADCDAALREFVEFARVHLPERF